MRANSEGVIIQREGALRQGLLDFIAAIDMADARMVEIGAYAGESSEMFAASGKVRELICVDPWRAGYDNADEASSSNMAAAEAAFDRVARRYPRIITKYKGTLAEFRKEHPDFCADIVYIDACHTYESCLRDIEGALALGPAIVSGHDYAHWCEGVVKAVNEILGQPHRRFQDGSWMVWRQPKA